VLKFRRVLKIDRFEAAPGGLTIVIGPVGSGKSSLLAALLGEAEQLSVAPSYSGFRGRMSYSSQIPWIINTTVEENVRFTDLDTKDADWYSDVLEACCLNDDLDLLPAGDQTEIGERGINLSGGQRARIAVARAVYRKNADVYLFDDPLAAIDAHVGKELFDNVFCPKGVLDGKTRILVTHQVQFLPFADRVVALENGSIVATGSYDELMASHPHLQSLGAHETSMQVANKNDKVTEDGSSMAQRRSSEREGRRSSGKLTTTEMIAEGAVGRSTFRGFALRGLGLKVCMAILFSATMKVVMQICTDLWLAYWVAEGDPFGFTLQECIGIYVLLGAIQAMFLYSRAASVTAVGLVNACRNLFYMLFTSVFGSPVMFFDLTPTGRLLNRFTADLDVLDNQFGRLIGSSFATLENILAAMVGMSLVSPLLVLIILPVGAMYYRSIVLFRHASRDSQRLEALTKTPIFNRISETLAGLSTVRAFGYEPYLLEKVGIDINRSQACNDLKNHCQQWLALHLEITSIVITAACTLFPLLPFLKAEQPGAAYVGITLAYSLDLARYVQFFAKSLNDVEQKFTSIERIFEYCDLPQEAAAVLPADSDLSKNWPPSGAIEFRDVSMRYRPELDPALRGLTFSIAASQKLGIVGRTGSGKSSIIVSMLRLTEVDTGHILVDGQDVRRMGLNTLRTRLAMIPQEPVLFGKTTLRRNLDPFGLRPDDEIMAALAKVQMDCKEVIPDGLDMEVQEGGTPFSVGQRQLLCLARAVLRRSRILLLDEATASVDNETDALIQRAIREIFKESTVVCIAHRIRTIMDSDRILVMGAGVCQEFGTPEELLATPGSEFRKLAEESNIPVPPLLDDPQIKL
jgi:ABC-type multidrug transport system fused ATPase/permease subunit